MLFRYLGGDERRYMDYADARTGRMLEVTPDGGDEGVYDVVRRDPALPLPPGDGRWGPAAPELVLPSAPFWTGADRELSPAQDDGTEAETPDPPESVLPSLPGESTEGSPGSQEQDDPEPPETGDGGTTAPSEQE